MKNQLINSISYIAEIRQILSSARQKAYSAVNFAMVEAYWLIGKRIVEEEQHGKERAEYGEEILQNLSKALTLEFGKGFSYANLRNFRQFYLTYPNAEICYTVCSKLSWSHNRLIMRVENKNAREYYLNEAAKQNWSVRVLERNINTFSYQRLLSSNQADDTVEQKDIEQFAIGDFIKDPYVFEFLNVPEPYNSNEKELETALIDNLQHFLMELGKGFSFVGRQFRISTETSHFYIDLVFYNYILKCFVLFDLKTQKLQHQDIGQMDMYVRMFDNLKRRADDNPTIGILLCSDTEKTVVQFSVLNESKQLFASKYIPYLPTEEELIAEIERQKLILKLKIES
ncbi:MAG: PDDEXK nuclease domain-containing protein [Bacteroidales bacterium]|jgi:predicted nuclease of restriction endonuclease-like (RecB) superfamily|nr:PDDEXK nuclease domain-containing protein [Bacteroidales bacterium]